MTNSKTLKRINVDTVEELFAKANIVPKQGDVFRCLMAAAVHPLSLFDVDVIKCGFDLTYSAGIMEGFDNKECVAFALYYKVNRTDLKYKLGKADGEACRVKIFGH